MKNRALSALPGALVLLFAATTVACSGGGGEATKAAEPVLAETPDAYRDHATKLRREGKHKEALAAALKAYTLAASGPRVAERLELAKIHGASGNPLAGINEIRSLIDEKNGTPPVAVDEVDIAEVYAQIGDTPAVFRWLPRAVDAKSPKLQGIETNVDLEPMKADPRWMAFLATIKK